MWLVTHATGTIGRAVVKAAADRGRHLRLVVPDTSELVTDLSGHDTVVADSADETQLTQAFEGIDALVLIARLGPGVGERHATLARIARNAGVSRIVQVSALGADPASPLRLLRWHGEAESRVTTTGLTPVVLRPALCMQVLFKQAVQICACSRIEAPARGAHWPLVDARDVGEVAVRVLEQDLVPQVLQLTGPESLDYAAIAARCSQVLGRHIDYLDICSPRARGTLEARGLSPRLIEGLLEFWDYVAAGALPMPVTNDVERILGRPPRSLTDFLRDAQLAFRPAANA